MRLGMERLAVQNPQCVRRLADASIVLTVCFAKALDDVAMLMEATCLNSRGQGGAQSALSNGCSASTADDRRLRAVRKACAPRIRDDLYSLSPQWALTWINPHPNGASG